MANFDHYFKHDPSMVQAWSKHGPSMVQAWSKHGPSMAQAWPKHGPSMIQAWSKHGPSMVQAWPKHGPSRHSAKNATSDYSETCSVHTSKGTQNQYILSEVFAIRVGLCTCGIHRDRMRSTYFPGESTKPGTHQASSTVYLGLKLGSTLPYTCFHRTQPLDFASQTATHAYSDVLD